MAAAGANCVVDLYHNNAVQDWDAVVAAGSVAPRMADLAGALIAYAIGLGINDRLTLFATISTWPAVTLSNGVMQVHSSTDGEMP